MTEQKSAFVGNQGPHGSLSPERIDFMKNAHFNHTDSKAAFKGSSQNQSTFQGHILNGPTIKYDGS